MYKALNNFFNDVTGILILLGIIIVFFVINAKSSFYKHDLLINYCKKNKLKLIYKEWHTKKDSDGIDETYYTIKYYDRNKKLHKATVSVDEINEELLFFDDKII